MSRFLWALPALVILAKAPAFLCMGLDPDPVQWDLFARSVANGGVPYRDVCENNLPGMLWLHLGIRSLLGWSSEALRGADLLVMCAVVALLARFSARPVGADASRPLVAVLLLAFYFSTSEWCHCQRDPWMLLPALGALALRFEQRERLAASRPVFLRAALEGALWGAAFWIKPYVIVPAVAAWLWSTLLRSRRGQSLADLGGLLVGGILVGAAGIAWLQATGGWPHFVETVFDWNRDYLAVDVYEGASRLDVWIAFAYRNWPWCIAYAIAVPYALSLLARGERGPSGLLAAFFLGWLLQAVVLQHCYDYVHSPALMLVSSRKFAYST